MFSKKIGSGSKVVVGIHGWGGTNNTFKPLEKLIPDTHSMINFDLPGYGKSRKPNNWDLKEIVDSLSDELVNIQSTDIDILGNCSGALIAILLSKSPRLKINNLYLIDPFSHAPWYFKIFTNRIIGEYAYVTTFQNPLGRFFTNLSLKKNKNEGTDMTSSFRNIDKETSLNYLRMLVELEGTSIMENINCIPTIINGGKTFKAANQSVNYYNSIWNNLNVIKIPGVGHLPLEENPSRIIEIVFKK